MSAPVNRKCLTIGGMKQFQKIYLVMGSSYKARFSAEKEDIL